MSALNDRHPGGRTCATRRPNGRRGLNSILVMVFVTLAQYGAAVQCGTAQENKPKLPPRQDMTLETEDGVNLRVSYWAGTKGKESVPVILLHAYQGSRQDFYLLAGYLQEQGCAVVAPDLRGHGDSTHVVGSNRTLSSAKMPPAAFAAMMVDVETVKKFLMARNNSGELNIDKLCLVGAEMGALVGANWAITDWGWPPLAVGKQGQDLKALVLLSPREKFKSLRMLEPLNDPAVRSRVAFYIAVGNQDPAALDEATKIHTALKRYHPEPSRGEERDLYLDSRIPTSRQGTKLLARDFKQYDLAENIAEFIDERAGKQPYPWRNRKLP